MSKGLNFQGANGIALQQFSTCKVLIENTALLLRHQALILTNDESGVLNWLGFHISVYLDYR